MAAVSAGQINVEATNKPFAGDKTSAVPQRRRQTKQKSFPQNLSNLKYFLPSRTPPGAVPLI